MAKKLAISNSAFQASKCCTNCVQISSIMFCERRLFFHLDFFFFFRATMSLTNFDQDHSRTSLENCSNEVNSTVATPEEFVTKYGGKRVIKKILIANNGIAGT